jgi:hypothetical protein
MVRALLAEGTSVAILDLKVAPEVLTELQRKRVLIPCALPREKGHRARRGSGGGDVLYLLAKMCQDSV